MVFLLGGLGVLITPVVSSCRQACTGKRLIEVARTLRQEGGEGSGEEGRGPTSREGR